MKNRHRYEIVMDETDHKILEMLKEKYAINISKCFKIFIKKYLEKLEKAQVDITQI